jgi:DNA polymerase
VNLSAAFFELNQGAFRLDSLAPFLTMKAKKPAQSADDFAHPAPVPATGDLALLRRAASRCTACPLYKTGTQTVFGEGQPKARLVLIGEQPGDQEDLAGHPFVGPAGHLLDRALAEAGIDRSRTYVTNAVKHFKWEPVGKRRLHKKPSAREVAACRPWLEAELKSIQPEVVVCLGSTAAQSLLGPQVRVLRDRRTWFKSEFCAKTLVTVHPSSLLRAPDPARREENLRLFLEDLRYAAAPLGKG